MKRIILESPFAAPAGAWFPAWHRWRNRRYARACVRHLLMLGESPIASHLLYTQRGILDDSDPVERKWGIDAGLAWLEVAERTVVYVDRGISRGMQYGIDAAKLSGKPVERRSIERWRKTFRCSMQQ